MKNSIPAALFLSLLLLFAPFGAAARQRPVKVACVGNSITYGAFIPDRERNSYPAQLQAVLGDGYEVGNFGVSGTTLLSKGDCPYVGTREYAASREFGPDIVLIKLGTNDTKPQNRGHAGEFAEDYRRLIESYRQLASHPRIVLLTPVRCFLPDDTSISPALISGAVRPAVERVAWENGTEIINMFNLFGDEWDEGIMPDRLHPSAEGAAEMARKIAAYIRRTEGMRPPREPDFLRGSAPFCFHGFRGYDFRCGGTACRIAVPYAEAEGRPWVIRARFWDHEPQTDIELLERGFHIVYCDVADLYGCEEAVGRWDSLYALMTGNGFAGKVVLEGMSRGGLIVYNWAARNPEKVACIYADAPVMDIASWPMGRGRSEGSAEDTRKMFSAYGFADEREALGWRGNPVDHAGEIARAGIPCLHVVGEADRVVPVEENTAVFERRMKRRKGLLTVIRKAGVGHHPHSLDDPQPIVDFILSAAGMPSDGDMCGGRVAEAKRDTVSIVNAKI